MAKNYSELSKAIIEQLGGPENISRIFHCATRLRTSLVNQSIADLEAIKAINGVMGVVEAPGGVQVIIGNDVSKVFDAAIEQYPTLEQGTNTDENLDQEKTSTNVFNRILDILSSLIGPAIPLIMVSGLLTAILTILTRWAGLSDTSSTYTILNVAANAAMYFLPIFIAYTASKKFGTNTMLSLFVGALMIHPSIVGLSELGSFVTLFGLPVKTADYTSTLIPIVLTIWALKYVEKLSEKLIPDSIKFVFRPLISVLIILPIALCVTGPIGSYIGDLLNLVMTSINNVAPWATILIVGALAPLLVLTGMHFALIPLVITEFATVGYDNMLFVAFIGMNFSQFGVALAAFLKTKNPNLKELAGSCALTAFLAGVTEPTLYGICLRMKKPLYATWIACIVNAIFCAIFRVKVFSFGAPSFFTMPIFMNPDGSMSNFWFAIVATVITIVVSFVSTWILGFDDSVYGTSEK
ncbi:MAG: PTS transporter subunit EIIC [Solobacterium sp.]|nr:PTS transporter subunit EIIC [Solobacterium sp.]